ncbi:hypothetical protein MNBD_IGNAVI01-1577 [hydrothermal vent metagenome]|uniref:Response regulatory domain-containing protein n=1 Tax=hydrothermal vent metagenome TaxID=652676 RepID=A0A3B1CAG2_9ZZZZ
METEIELVIIEDDPNDAEMISDVLQNKVDLQKVKFIKDGEEAIIFLRDIINNPINKKNPLPKLMVLDLKLPKVSGLEILKEIKSGERAMGIPVVILSSSKEESDLKTAYDLCVNSYVVKTLNFEEFSFLIGNIIFYWLNLNEVPL